MKKIEKSIVLASGGLDSTTLMYFLLDKKVRFDAVFINYGQHCVTTELETLRSVLPKNLTNNIIQLDLSTVYENSKSLLIKEANLWKDKVTHNDFYLPYRNLLFLSIGAAFAQSNGYSTVYAGFINSNHAKEIDCSAKFFNTLSELLTEYGTVDVKMPFRDLSKYEVAKIGISVKAPIGKTFSCQASSEIPCGACPNCVDRLEALKQL
jgi:7-cyano-7-deazaguanine synthase